jgi:hypothetical protein
MVNFWNGLTWPLRVMVLALIVMAASQFFFYSTQPSPFSFGVSADPFGAAAAGGTGWQLHPQAYILLPLLAFALLQEELRVSRMFQRWGWWGSAIVLALCAFPGEWLSQPGAALGAAAVGVAIIATLLHYFGPRSAEK